MSIQENRNLMEVSGVIFGYLHKYTKVVYICTPKWYTYRETSSQLHICCQRCINPKMNETYCTLIAAIQVDTFRRN